MNKPTIVVTGASGFVGRHLVEAAQAEGYLVRALSRSSRVNRDNICWYEGSLSDKKLIDEMVSGADFVVHLGAELKARRYRAFYETNVEGTSCLVSAIEREQRRAGRQIYTINISSLAATKPTLSHYGDTKNQAESIIKDSELPWTIIRPPAVYGPADTEMVGMFKIAQWQTARLPHFGRTSLLHVSDLVGLILSLLVHRPIGLEFEPDDNGGEGWGIDVLIKKLAQRTGNVPELARIWPKAIKACGFCLDWLPFRGSLPVWMRGLTLDRARYLCEPYWVSNDKLQVPPDVWVPNVQLDEGLDETFKSYIDSGWLKMRHI